MRGKWIPPLARQPVHEWHIAELILSPPVNPMCLEGIAAVGAKDHHPPTRFEGAHHLTHSGGVILNMLENFVAQN